MRYIDAFNHFFPKRFFAGVLETPASQKDMGKRIRGIPALFDLEASSPLINSAVPPNFSECFRTLRTNVLFSTADEGLRSLVVTSTGPGEGKTLVSTNLAVGLAQAGMRVLLGFLLWLGRAADPEVFDGA